MKIIVLGDDAAWSELSQLPGLIEWKRAANTSAFLNEPEADAFFNLTGDACETSYDAITKPVLINSVVKTLKEMNAAENVIRINGWNGFLKRNSWEAAGSSPEIFSPVFSLIQKKMIVVPDEPGFISARILSMIINEGYYALGEDVSTEAEIDIAMKLGTNYPKGPFEWAKKIGIKNVFSLLQQLSVADNRYQPSPMLTQEANKN